MDLDDLVESVQQTGKPSKRLKSAPQTEQRDGNKAAITTVEMDAEDDHSTSSHPSSTADPADLSTHADSEDDPTEQTTLLDDTNNIAHTYHPSKGEDIYGRPLQGIPTASSSKYIPPARRSAANPLLQHQITGLMNKLSNSSRDFIIKQLLGCLSSHSTSEVVDTLITQIHSQSITPHAISSFIPLQMVIVTAIYICHGQDIGNGFIEKTLARLWETLNTQNPRFPNTQNLKSGDADESNKSSHNCLLMVVYLYNYKILHHTLIMDLLLALLSPGTSPFVDMDLLDRIELIEVILHHAGSTLRVDDPLNVLTVTNTLKSLASTTTTASSRLTFLLDTLTDLHKGRMKAQMLAVLDTVKAQRKYLGTVKSSHNKSALPMRMGLQDILDIPTKGRWWRVGGAFQNPNPNPTRSDETLPSPSTSSSAQPQSDAMLSKLSSKLQLTTAIRKQILKILLSARDVHSAYEQLVNLKAADREIVRVLLECCGKEAKYNAFYTECIGLLVKDNRHYKLSLQYALWDLFSSLPAHNNTFILHTAQLTAALIQSFALSLAVIRPIEMGDLQPQTVLFLSTLFLCVFRDASDEVFESVFDRLSTVKELKELHANIMYFLEVSHMHPVLRCLSAVCLGCVRACVRVRGACVCAFWCNCTAETA